MTLRRGFKTEANKRSIELRHELGLAANAPLSPWHLAQHLEIPVLPMTDLLKKTPAAVRYFSGGNQSEFSGLTVFDGNRRMIFYNDRHSRGRQSNDLCHELSHGVLLHPARPAVDQYGCRFWDDEIEEEANWLAGVLLVPEEAAMSIVRRGLSPQDAANEYVVSVRMMSYRLSVTAARLRVDRYHR